MPKSVLKPGNYKTDYSVSQSKKYFTIAEARAEYSRLRKIAEKRLRRMGQSRFEYTDIYQRYRDSFAPLPRGASEERVRKKLSDVAHFVELQTASISGMKSSQAKQVETMQEQGFTFINEGNVNDFNRYMQRVNQVAKELRKDYSQTAVEMFHDAEEADLDPMEVAEDFLEYLEGVKEIPEPPESDEEEDEALEEIRQQPAVKKPKEPRRKAEPKAKEAKRKKGKK